MDKIRMVIVDDDKNFRIGLKEYFQSHQTIEVVAEAKDGAQAINIIEEKKPDIVVLDTVMSCLDGIGVLEYFNNIDDFEKPKFIMTSYFAKEMIIQKVISLGASYFMVKPFELSTLTERIKIVMSERKVYFINEEFSTLEEEATGTVGYIGGLTLTRKNDFDMLPSDKEAKEIKAAKKLEVEVTRLMHDIGVPAHIKGYQYLRDSIVLAINEPEVINAMTKVLYPHIAKKHYTTPSRVERAIRHAIEVAWNRGQIEIFNEVFGYSISTGRGKPTNGEFIAMIADRIRLKM